MASRPPSSASRVVSLLILAAVLTGCWYLAPLFLPVWRWQNIDFAQLAKELKLDEPSLRRQFDVELAYMPRSELDPRPWVLLAMTPNWAEIDPTHEKEDHYLLRCSVRNDRTGDPPSKLWLGTGHHSNRFFTAKAWRFPAGTFGNPGPRPVIVYDSASFEYMDMGRSGLLDREIRLSNAWEKDTTDEYSGDAGAAPQ